MKILHLDSTHPYLSDELNKLGFDNFFDFKSSKKEIENKLFIYHGIIDWYYAGIILVAGGMGTYWGIKHGIHKGEEWVRYIVLLVVFVFGTKMLFF